jgi:hypothetical protein
MALTAARAAVHARMQRKKLLEHAQTITSTSLSEAEREQISKALRNNQSTAFLTDLLKGELPSGSSV